MRPSACDAAGRLSLSLHAATKANPGFPFQKRRGTGFAGPQALPPASGKEKRHEVREAWG